MTPTFNDLPLMMAEILERQKNLEDQIRRLELTKAEKVSKGKMLSGYRSIKDHYQVTAKTIQGWITEGAPFYKKGNIYFCYTNELDAFLKKNNPFFKTS